jgi:hypothetical protein
VKLTIHLHLVPMLQMSRFTPPIFLHGVFTNTLTFLPLATGWTVGESGLDTRRGQRVFSSPEIQSVCSSHRFLSSEKAGSFLGVKLATA